MVGSGVIAVLGAMLLSCNVQAYDVPVVQEPQQEIQYLGEFKLTAYCSCSKCCGVWAENRPKDSNGNDIVIGGQMKGVYMDDNKLKREEVIKEMADKLKNQASNRTGCDKQWLIM